MATIVDVARLASVSIATVSRVFSKPDAVSDKVRERVMLAAQELDFEVNRAARSLRTLKTHKILVTVPDVSNPFFSTIIRGVEAAAREADYAVVLGDTRHDPDLENQYALMLRRREVDGVIYLGHRLPSVLAGQINEGPARTPVVNGCEYSPGLPTASVHIDNHRAGADAVRHLAQLGHRSIGIVTGPLFSPLSRDRLSGAQELAAQHGFADQLMIREGDFSVESGFVAAQQLFRNGATAIFCFSDEMAMGALKAASTAGLACPQDVSVVGFDDIRFSRYLTPSLTTIRQPAAEIGRIAVKMLLERMTGELVEPENVVLDHDLIVRDSTGPARS